MSYLAAFALGCTLTYLMTVLSSSFNASKILEDSCLTFAFLIIAGYETNAEQVELIIANNKMSEEEAKRFTLLMTLASEEAVLRAKSLALQPTNGGYEFVLFNAGKWEPIKQDDVLGPRSLPEGMELTLELDGEPATLGDKNKETTSRIYILSSGELTPFRVDLRSIDREYHFRITGQPFGDISYEDATRT